MKTTKNNTAAKTTMKASAIKAEANYAAERATVIYMLGRQRSQVQVVGNEYHPTVEAGLLAKACFRHYTAALASRGQDREHYLSLARDAERNLDIWSTVCDEWFLAVNGRYPRRGVDYD